jgi:hypothetical protein
MMGHSRYFTVEEANALIPDLEQRFSRILQMRAQMRAAYHTLEEHDESPTPETLAREDGPQELRQARARFRGLMEAVHEELQAIEQTGAQVKDLDIGLCDFLGQRGGREIFLCWRYGEKRIAFYHDLTAGYAGRQPIEP